MRTRHKTSETHYPRPEIIYCKPSEPSKYLVISLFLVPNTLFESRTPVKSESAIISRKADILAFDD